MNFLFKPKDIASLVFFRIVFGILAFADVMGLWTYYHLYKDSYNPDKFQFKYYGFEWVQPLSEPLMSLFFIVLLGTAICIAMGKWYRLCTVFFAFGFTYTFLLEKAHYLNHGYLFCIISFGMIFLPAHRAFSADVLKNPKLESKITPYWTLFLVQFMMGCVYFFGGVAKINPDWLNGMPLKLWLGYKSDMPILGGLWAQEWVAYVMSYGGLILDLTIVFFLINRRTRLWALYAAIFFHSVNLILFQIGIFPFLSVALTLMFFPSDFPRKILLWMEQKPGFERIVIFCKRKWLERKSINQNSKVLIDEDTEQKIKQDAFQDYWQFNSSYRFIISCCLFVFCIVFMLLPLRHHYFKGDVAWTEEGHRFAWRMMLRSKQGYGNFKVKNLETNKTEIVQPRAYLSNKQRRKMYTHPDMILQFVHWLDEQYENKGEKVAIYANIKIKLNGREYQVYIDPTVDLTKIDWSFWKESDWVLPETK